jgi:hypothetical protein
MPDYVTREEFEARVGVLESEVEGEKLVTRHILQQTRLNGDDLAAIKTRLARVETDVAQLKSELRSFRKDMPDIVSGAMRDVLRKDKGR